MTGTTTQKRHTIVESVPDKNGIIIIAIKTDINGRFGSRDGALDSILTNHSSTTTR